MRILLSLLFVLVAVPVVAQTPTVYRWVDAQGVVHYSDQPHKGATKVNLGANTTVLDFKAPKVATVAAKAAPAAAKPSYKLKILAPSPGTTLRPVNYRVHVNVRVRPALAGAALLHYQLDGKPIGKPTARTAIEMHKVYRGTHTLTVSVVGPHGEVWGQANSTFYVHQHSLLDPGRHQHVKSRGGGG